MRTLILLWAVVLMGIGGGSEHLAGADLTSFESGDDSQTLLVGFAEADITPDLAKGPVWLAGYAPGRRAAGVHDPLMARCVVLRHRDDKIALVSLDLVGLQYPQVKQIREKLRDYRYVVVSSTHNHEGPDVVGLWGESWWKRGVDDQYLASVVTRAAEIVRQAEQGMTPAKAEYGTATDESLLADNREPHVKDGVLRVLRFIREESGAPIGVLVQWNCHPESLGSRNLQVTADFPAFTVAELKRELDCPIAYFSGAVGGLMTNPSDRIHDENGKLLEDGNFEYARRYGREVAELTKKALGSCAPVSLTPFAVAARPIAIPIENPIYRAGREIGILQRPGRVWTGDAETLGREQSRPGNADINAVETEVGYVRLGEVHVACIPGELYPELVYGQVQDPTDPGADFPSAPVEPCVAKIMPGPKWLLLGLANDEVGYIIPRRQWDEKPPYCYGRTRAQYGEVNSCGPGVAPIIMQSLANRVSEAGR